MKKYLIFTRYKTLEETTEAGIKGIEIYNNDLICCYEDDNIIVFCDCSDDEETIINLLVDYLNIEAIEIMDNMNATCGMFADKF